MRSPTRASELVTDVQEASLPPVREEDRHRPRGAAGGSRPEGLTADIRAGFSGRGGSLWRGLDVGPGQQLVYPGRRVLAGQAGEDVGEVGLGVDVVQLA